MNKIEIIQYLLDEIQEEIKYEKSYKAKLEKHKKIPPDGANDRTYDWDWYRDHREPKVKARVKENCKLIRRLALELSKEV